MEFSIQSKDEFGNLNVVGGAVWRVFGSAVQSVDAAVNCPGRRGRLRALRVSLCKSVLYAAFVRAQVA